MKRAVGWIPALLLIICLAAPAIRPADAAPGFIENRGQLDARVLYYLTGPGATVYVTAEALVFDLRAQPGEDGAGIDPRRPRHEPHAGTTAANMEGGGCALYLRLTGGGAAPRIEARGRLPGRYHFLLGNDPARWRTDVPAFAEVVYRDAWPGVELVLRSRGGQIVYETVAAGGVAAPTVLFQYEGADEIVRLADASVSLETPAGRLVQISSAEGAGVFTVRAGDPAGAPHGGLKNDPSALIWSTYLGGSSEDIAYAVALDPSGNPVIAGASYSTDFPVTPGAYDISHGEYRDAFVSKFSSTGSDLLWSTFLGGDGFDYGYALALDVAGNTILTGATRSTNFPTTPGAFDETFNGSSNENAFVAKLSSTGNQLIWSTFLGRSAAGYALVFDAAENPVLTGMTGYSDFPTTVGAHDTSHNGGRDVFVAKFSSTGSTLLFSTFLGGSTDDWGLALALDASGDHVITGYTWSSNFPTTPGAYDQTWNGGNTDAFVAKLSSTGSELLWSTYLGASGTDDGYALALDGSCNPVVTGRTSSDEFPVTPGAYDTDLQDGYEVFVSKLSSTGANLLWSTFLGGSSGEAGNAVVLDAAGNPVVTGYTGSTNFPTTPDAYDTSYNVSNDVFLVRLSSDGSELLYSTFLGGNAIEEGHALVLDGSGKAVVAGRTQSTNFPTTTGAYDTSHNGNYDVAVAKLDLRTGATAVDDGADASVAAFLHAAPNPFHGRAVIRYALARDAEVALDVYDARGRLVAPLAAGPRAAGAHGVIWNGHAADGERAAAGVYFVRLRAAGRELRDRIVLLR